MLKTTHTAEPSCSHSAQAANKKMVLNFATILENIPDMFQTLGYIIENP